MTPVRWFVALVPFALLAACGGESFSDSGEGGEGGEGGSTAGNGGASASGRTGSGGRGGSTGTAGTGTAGTGVAGTGTAGTVGVAGSVGTGGTGTCCAAYPACNPGDVEVPSSESCRPGASCYSSSLCCSTIWCTGELAVCNAFPTCDEGDTQLTGECPPNVSCYTRTLCGATIWCLDRSCDPATEYGRKYFESGCDMIDAMPCEHPGTSHFKNDCGCGCEQDPMCPPHLFCTVLRAEDAAFPGPSMGGSSAGVPTPGTGGGSGAEPPPLCSAEELERCPYSETY